MKLEAGRIFPAASRLLAHSKFYPLLMLHWRSARDAVQTRQTPSERSRVDGIKGISFGN